MDVTSIIHAQTEAIARVAHNVARVHDQMELLRTKYNQTERGENVLLKAEMAEYERQVRLEQQSKQQFMKAAGSAPQQQATTTAASAPSSLVACLVVVHQHPAVLAVDCLVVLQRQVRLYLLLLLFVSANDLVELPMSFSCSVAYVVLLVYSLLFSSYRRSLWFNTRSSPFYWLWCSTTGTSSKRRPVRNTITCSTARSSSINRRFVR